LLTEIASIVRPYGVRKIACDRWSFDAHRDLARQNGIDLIETGTAERDAGYSALASAIASGPIDLPPDALAIQDLKSLRKIITPQGFRVHLPHTVDGRHCDHAPSIAGAVHAVAERGRSPGSRMLAALNAAVARDAPVRSFRIQNAFPNGPADPSILSNPDFSKFRRYLP
jgi:hypothetical protein